MVAGTRDLECWVLEPSGYLSSTSYKVAPKIGTVGGGAWGAVGAAGSTGVDSITPNACICTGNMDIVGLNTTEDSSVYQVVP